jgi:hypothetical protein
MGMDVDWLDDDWLAGVEENGIVVVPAAEGVIVVEIELLEDVLVEEEELGKFHPFIWTPCITDPVPVMVIVVGTHDPSVELRGVMTWPFVNVERHSLAAPAAKMLFWYV